MLPIVPLHMHQLVLVLGAALDVACDTDDEVYID